MKRIIRVGSMSKFDPAQEELTMKKGKVVKALDDMEKEHTEPYILKIV